MKLNFPIRKLKNENNFTRLKEDEDYKGSSHQEDDGDTVPETPESSLANDTSANVALADHLTASGVLIANSISLMDISVEDDDASTEDEYVSTEDDLNNVSSLSLSIQNDTNNDPTQDNSQVDKTEASIANFSDSIADSFCHPSTENHCTIPDQCHPGYGETNPSQLAISEKIAQGRLLEDIHYLLGSSILPCCAEKGFFKSCLRPIFSDPVAVQKIKIRNRAGESWRARAYRIRRLREERMMHGSSLDPVRNEVTTTLEKVQLQHSRSMDPTVFPKQRALKEYSQMHTPPTNLGIRELNPDPLGRIIGDCVEPISVMEMKGDSETVLMNRSSGGPTEEHVLCYDSDPGESCRMRERCVKSNSERWAKDRSKSLLIVGNSTESNENGKSIPFKRRRRMHFDSLFEDDEDEDDNEVNEDFHAKNQSITNVDSTNDDVELFRDGVLEIKADAPKFKEETEDLFKDLDQSYDSDQCYHGDDFDESDMLWDTDAPLFKEELNTNSFHDFDIQSSIQEVLNTTYTLTWHPSTSNLNQFSQEQPIHTSKIPLTNTKKGSNSLAPSQASTPSPRCIQLWFERGNRIRHNDIVEPKLMWRDAYHPDLASRRKLNISSTQKPNQVCLLSICRVLETSDLIDRKKYPFAKKSCSFLIRTCDDDEFLFEARNDEERERIVHLWKLVVARLASQAVVGNGEGMLGEFFIPLSYGVQ